MGSNGQKYSNNIFVRYFQRKVFVVWDRREKGDIQWVPNRHLPIPRACEALTSVQQRQLLNLMQVPLWVTNTLGLFSNLCPDRKTSYCVNMPITRKVRKMPVYLWSEKEVPFVCWADTDADPSHIFLKLKTYTQPLCCFSQLREPEEETICNVSHIFPGRS